MILNKKPRPMTRNEKRDRRELKRAQRRAKMLFKKAKRTLDWLDVTDIEDDSVVIGKGHKPMRVKGIKISPHNIFIDDPSDQNNMIEKLTTCLNHCPDHLYFGFVLNPVDLHLHDN